MAVYRFLYSESIPRSGNAGNIRGVYVPFWLYDYDASADLKAECTKIHHERKGDMEYTHTDYYMVERDARGSYLKVPVMLGADAG